jgi:DNA polymerase III psi subunit
LPEQPVWAWPAGHDGGCSAAQLVDEHLFTDVLVFGAECARAVFGSPLPELVGQARILVVPAMDELSNQPAARRSLWQCLCVSKLTAV